MKIKIFGIKNCNTMKNTFIYFSQKKVDVAFEDYKKTPPSYDFLNQLDAIFGIEKIINKSGTTYKKLSDVDKINLNDKGKAIEILIKNSSMIKRPIVQFSEVDWVVGYHEDQWEALLK
jgi:Spx/MgsR family transcriptional regulator